MRYQHGAATDFAALKLGVNIDGLVQRRLRDFGVNAPVPSHRDDLNQFRAGSPIRETHNAPVWRAAVVKVVMAAA